MTRTDAGATCVAAAGAVVLPPALCSVHRQLHHAEHVAQHRSPRVSENSTMVVRVPVTSMSRSSTTRRVPVRALYLRPQVQGSIGVNLWRCSLGNSPGRPRDVPHVPSPAPSSHSVGRRHPTFLTADPVVGGGARSCRWTTALPSSPE